MSKSGQPRPLSDADVAELLDLVHERHGLGYELAGSFRGGEGPGAHALRGEDGEAVLKVVDGISERADVVARTLEVLRGRGYPVPAYLCWGASPLGEYLIQERLPGEPAGMEITVARIDEVLVLNELQTDCPVDLPDGWPDAVVDPVLHGGPGFCLLDTMRAHSTEAAELLDTVQRLAGGNVDDARRARDAVHLDFTSSNILAAGDELTGVIDWEAVRTGDRAFDLTTMLFYAFDHEQARKRLLARVLELSGPASLKVYMAHMIHRQVEWSIRFHEPQVVRFFLERARAVLDDVGRR